MSRVAQWNLRHDVGAEKTRTAQQEISHRRSSWLITKTPNTEKHIGSIDMVQSKVSVFVLGVSHVFWSCDCDAASLPFEEVGPTVVFEAAFHGEQSVGFRLGLAALARLKRLPTICLLALSTTPEPIGSPSFRQRS